VAKFDDLMYHKTKLSPVIGWEHLTTPTCRLWPYKRAMFPTNHRAVFYLLHQITEFCQMEV